MACDVSKIAPYWTSNLYGLRCVITSCFTFSALTSTIGNTSFIVVLLRSRTLLRDAHYVLLLVIAVCDLSISISGYPFTIISSFYGDWIFGDAMCKAYAFCCFTFSSTSAHTLVVISIFRYVAICRPERSREIKVEFQVFEWHLLPLWLQSIY